VNTAQALAALDIFVLLHARKAPAAEALQVGFWRNYNAIHGPRYGTFFP
jgi:hypothetical protein